MSIIGPLTVLDMGQNISGPLATTLLAALGARVIKLETPGRGDGSRIGPPYAGQEGVTFQPGTEAGMALSFLKRNRNKEAITVDLRSPEGKELFIRLVHHADVLVENFKPGTLDRMGFPFARLQEINSRLIVCSVSGFGLSGPYRDWLAYDTVIQAMSGLMYHTGYPDRPPVKSALTVADSVGALYATIGILAALQHRQLTGRGQLVEVPMLDCLLSLVWDEPWDYYERTGMEPRSGNRLSRCTPWNVYPASDGHVFLCALTDEQWRRLAEAIAPDLADRYPDMATRIEHNAEIDAAIAGWTQVRSKTEIPCYLQARGVPCAPVLTATEVANDSHVQERQMLRPVPHPDLDEVPDALVWQFPLRFSASPPVPLSRPAPRLGQDNAEVLRQLGTRPGEGPGNSESRCSRGG